MQLLPRRSVWIFMPEWITSWARYPSNGFSITNIGDSRKNLIRIPRESHENLVNRKSNALIVNHRTNRQRSPNCGISNDLDEAWRIQITFLSPPPPPPPPKPILNESLWFPDERKQSIWFLSNFDKLCNSLQNDHGLKNPKKESAKRIFWKDTQYSQDCNMAPKNSEMIRQVFLT